MALKFYKIIIKFFLKFIMILNYPILFHLKIRFEKEKMTILNNENDAYSVTPFMFFIFQCNFKLVHTLDFCTKKFKKKCFFPEIQGLDNSWYSNFLQEDDSNVYN